MNLFSAHSSERDSRKEENRAGKAHELETDQSRNHDDNGRISIESRVAHNETGASTRLTFTELDQGQAHLLLG